MTTKMGRPKADNPKVKQHGVRFDIQSLRKIDMLAAYYSTTRVEVLRMGVEKLFSELPK